MVRSAGLDPETMTLQDAVDMELMREFGGFIKWDVWCVDKPEKPQKPQPVWQALYGNG